MVKTQVYPRYFTLSYLRLKAGTSGFSDEKRAVQNISPLSLTGTLKGSHTENSMWEVTLFIRTQTLGEGLTIDAKKSLGSRSNTPMHKVNSSVNGPADECNRSIFLEKRLFISSKLTKSLSLKFSRGLE